MSYAVPGKDSEIWLYKNVNDDFVLALPGKRRRILKGTRQAYKVLMQLRSKGIAIPQYTLDRLQKEML